MMIETIAVAAFTILSTGGFFVHNKMRPVKINIWGEINGYAIKID